jgi:hypothetical protein
MAAFLALREALAKIKGFARDCCVASPMKRLKA